MAFRKAALTDFQGHLKDIKLQLLDQIKCLEGRTETQVNIYHEINDFCKKKAEIDQEYSKQLDKLVKSVMIKYKNEKNKRNQWTIYSPCNLFMQLVDDTKEEAKNKSMIAEVMGAFATQSINQKCIQMQKIAKKCREIGTLAQGEIIRVLNELNLSMKTYFECFEEAQSVKNKLIMAEEKNKNIESSGRKQKALQKNLTKRSEKYDAAKQKCSRARNEYLLCIDAANSALHKFFADDLSDLIDCTDVGTDYWLSLLLDNIINARKVACHGEMQSLAQLNEYRQSIAECERQKCDKQRFFESQNSTFMLPRMFEFKADPSENINHIALEDGLCEDLNKRHQQMRIRLKSLREESEKTSEQLLMTQQRIRELLAQQQALEVTNKGVVDHRPAMDASEAELDQALDEYCSHFSFFLLNANLIVRLEARADGIERALESFDPETNTQVQLPARENGDQVAEWHEKERRKLKIGVPNNSYIQSQASPPEHRTAEYRPSMGSVAKSSLSSLGTDSKQTPPSTRTGSTPPSNGGSGPDLLPITSPAPQRRYSHQHHPLLRRPRLFGGALDEYIHLTGEQIPLIVTSCIRVLSQYALHHQGLFRVSGSQVEINRVKDSFEEGDDPLLNIRNASDNNSIAGVLKLYFRELREPVFPFFMFERITDCAKLSNIDEFINKITELINKLPPPSYLLLRYLFAFLNHVSQFSDENMMDAYNLAICFGPTLLRIPETKDQVYYQNYVNDVVKNLILYHNRIFSNKVPGPLYNITNPGFITEDVEQFVDESDDMYNQGVASLSTTDTMATVSTLNENGSTNLNSLRYSLNNDPCSSTQGAIHQISPKNAEDIPNFCYSSSENSVKSAVPLNSRKSVCIADENKGGADERRLSLLVGSPVSDGTLVGCHHQARNNNYNNKGQLKVDLNQKDDDSGTGGCSPAGKSAESDSFNTNSSQNRPSIDSGIGNANPYAVSSFQSKPKNNIPQSNSNTLGRMRIPVPPRNATETSTNSSSNLNMSQVSEPPPYHHLYSSINKSRSASTRSGQVASRISQMEDLCIRGVGPQEVSPHSLGTFSSTDSIDDHGKLHMMTVNQNGFI
ncbi:unnamed protein product [Bursaphelenchus xylophilus]|uniref:(pine wood nematode) hypothetical protein n=1 Tax=Bursaphelenchus xylophilus TaxID=6326 RepID=A0A1I7RHG9_BURXY|nr:unnamed protein product [Bursaphelenchus xylophilus]CAG9115764.1 unnamed protein product [Bursaphelenchus xylophilus]